MEYDSQPELKKFETPQPAEKIQSDSIIIPEKQEKVLDKTKQVVESQQEHIKPLETTSKKKIRLPTFHRTPPTIPHLQDELSIRVEKIMEEGLGDAFQRLSPIAREEFKLKGEQTAFKIHELMKGAHVKAKKIFRLLMDWLKMLPGINTFFLEQEAKIKTDRILMINQKK